MNNILLKSLLVTTLVSAQVLSLVGCQEKEPEPTYHSSNFTGDYTDILYNPFTQQLIKYDANTGAYDNWKPTANGGGQFQYKVPNSGRLFVDGNSTNNNFSLLEIDGRDINTIHQFEENDGAFPLGLSDNKLYFIHTYNNEKGSEFEDKRRIAIYDLTTKKTTDLEQIKGLITKGNIDDGFLFYTVYDAKLGSYNLYKLPLDDIQSNPLLISQNIKSSEVLIKDGKPCVLTQENIICDNKQWKKNAINYIIDNNLVQIDTSNSTLDLSITNMETGEINYEADNVVGLDFLGNKIIVGSLGMSKYKI